MLQLIHTDIHMEFLCTPDLHGQWVKGSYTGHSGATGHVYNAIVKHASVANDTNDVKEYVIKEVSLIPEDDSDTKLYKQDVIKQTSNEIRFQNIAAKAGLTVPVIDTRLDESSYCMLMPRLHQTARVVLRNLLHRDQRAVIEQIRAVLLHILGQLHVLNIVHGDVNLDNFMCSRSGRWYVIDFDRAWYSENKEDHEYDLYSLNRYVNNLIKNVF